MIIRAESLVHSRCSVNSLNCLEVWGQLHDLKVIRSDRGKVVSCSLGFKLGLSAHSDQAHGVSAFRKIISLSWGGHGSMSFQLISTRRTLRERQLGFVNYQEPYQDLACVFGNEESNRTSQREQWNLDKRREFSRQQLLIPSGWVQRGASHATAPSTTLGTEIHSSIHPSFHSLPPSPSIHSSITHLHMH